MLKFFYYPLCPLCQKIHWIILKLGIICEKISITHPNDLVEHNLKFWNNFFYLPILKINEKEFLNSSIIITNYLFLNFANEYISFSDQNFIEILDKYFYSEVYMNLIYDKTYKISIFGKSDINSDKINKGIEYLIKYLQFFENYLNTNHNWMNNKNFSICDITLFMHLMVLDYFSYIFWQNYPEIKKWYVKIKSKSEISFILNSSTISINPSSHFFLLDF